ncbi:16S rRNA (uracil(1498)-N(3))-methyltransferase [Acidisoma cellulosilytica]|uniref:Ribosomal RNA small subunit methyltransferase E n=1 Tax=Acidisoma cellulosilyticum TaxID=2802395 RepID=A0A964E4B3_9PROT|nr:16S rRNA (uracil(1498)-N(3))-methyltransferase [Acidisoma cellulosilyticum]MCB8880788.1 16S rRNA (uracil(1498)-N(3))-methyltransferase [Acidisoma cellulosilyticum]
MTDPSAPPDSGSIRLHVQADLAAGAPVLLDEGQSRYLGTVMRKTAGDALRLFNGRDGEWRAVIGEIGKRGARLEAETLIRPQAPEPDLWLLISIIKRDALEWVVEKATELGVSVILPVITQRSQPARPNAERLQTIATEAAEQCERLTVPMVRGVQPLDGLLRQWPNARPLIAAVERDDVAPPPPQTSSPAALLIGPEGGFDPRELDAMRKLPFLVPASLGPRILRAETAAIVGLALLQRP